MNKPDSALEQHTDLDHTLLEALEKVVSFPDLVRQRDMDHVVQSALNSLDELHQGNQMPMMYASAVISMASRYIDVRDPQKALEALKRFPPVFYRAVLPKMMEADPELAARAIKLANAFIEAGVVELRCEHNLAEIQPQGDA